MSEGWAGGMARRFKRGEKNDDDETARSGSVGRAAAGGAAVHLQRDWQDSRLWRDCVAPARRRRVAWQPFGGWSHRDRAWWFAGVHPGHLDALRGACLHRLYGPGDLDVPQFLGGACSASDRSDRPLSQEPRADRPFCDDLGIRPGVLLFEEG